MTFINRTEEITYLNNYLTGQPNALLLLYGPKSSGKSVLLHKVINELLNLFVSLTKTSHVAHIILATADSYFLEELYAHAKLQQASRSYIVDHLSQSSVEEWLLSEHFTPNDIQIVWHDLGGSPWEITEVIRQKQQGKAVQASCQEFIQEKYGKIADQLFRMQPQKRKVCYAVLEKIVAQGICLTKEIAEPEKWEDVFQHMVAHDFWFYRVAEQYFAANSKNYYWAFERLFKQKTS